MVLENIHNVIPRTYAYVPLHGKTGFTDVIQLRTLMWGDYPRVSGWAHGNHKRPLEKSYRRQSEEYVAMKGRH